MRVILLLTLFLLPVPASARRKASSATRSSSRVGSSASSSSSSAGSSSSKSKGGGHGGQMSKDPDLVNWEKELDGHSGFDDVAAEASSGMLDVGQREVQELERGETRLLEFELDAPGRCSLEVKGGGAKPQLAFLDQSTRVAALGHTASLTPGTYFVRLKARQAGRYSVRLTCPTGSRRRHGTT